MPSADSRRRSRRCGARRPSTITCSSSERNDEGVTARANGVDRLLDRTQRPLASLVQNDDPAAIDRLHDARGDDVGIALDRVERARAETDELHAALAQRRVHEEILQADRRAE